MGNGDPRKGGGLRARRHLTSLEGGSGQRKRRSRRGHDDHRDRRNVGGKEPKTFRRDRNKRSYDNRRVEGGYGDSHRGPKSGRVGGQERDPITIK